MPSFSSSVILPFTGECFHPYGNSEVHFMAISFGVKQFVKSGHPGVRFWGAEIFPWSRIRRIGLQSSLQLKTCSIYDFIHGVYELLFSEHIHGQSAHSLPVAIRSIRIDSPTPGSHSRKARSRPCCLGKTTSLLIFFRGQLGQYTSTSLYFYVFPATFMYRSAFKMALPYIDGSTLPETAHLS